MTRREAWLSVLIVTVVALAVRIWAASFITFARPEDTAYYVGVARNLVSGAGLVTNAIWSFGTPPLEFPRPAFEVWLPLPSLLAAAPMTFLGTTFAAAQWSSILVGTLVAVLTWRLAADVAAEQDLEPGRARTLGRYRGRRDLRSHGPRACGCEACCTQACRTGETRGQKVTTSP